MPPHKLGQIIGEQSKENEFLLKMIGIPRRERESEYSCRNSIQALTSIIQMTPCWISLSG
jgi:hypothetical protein